MKSNSKLNDDVNRMMKSYCKSVEYYKERLDHSYKYEAGKASGNYERKLIELQDNIDTLKRKYPEYLV